ncbi:MAG: OPT family oligopeptide transporter [Verrucomicrobiota bacterium]|nr:OPT family oligopeptide transporter [Verrucomicrobiota bacterium]
MSNENTSETPNIDPIPTHLSPEEKDRLWLETVYQGDNQRQLTVRAVLMGGLLGMLMSVANLYTTLKIGWAFGVAVTACVLSYVIWNGLRFISGNRLSQMSLLENNCMQSTASAAGYSTGATIATAFGALLLIEGQHQQWLIVGSFTLCTAALGVFLAVPMKRQMINQEQLAFPTGIACAATLKSLYSKGAESIKKAYALVGSLVAGLMIGVLNTGEGTLSVLDKFFEKTGAHLPELIPSKGFQQIHDRQLLGFGFEPSGLLIAAGMIVGLRVCISMLLGAILLYFVVGPYLIGVDLLNLDQPDYVASIPIVGGGTIYHLTRWALWAGTAVMVFASLASFAIQWPTLARSFRLFKKAGVTTESVAENEIQARLAAIEVPNSWLVAGLVPVFIAMLAVQYLSFHINIWLGTISTILAFVLSLVACRATGETDTTPLGAMGKVVQLIFAVISPPSATNPSISIQHNLMAASVTANSASASADLLTDLKSGYLLGANPRKQFLAQFTGIFFGTLAIVPAWYLMVPTKEALEKFNPPATNMWKAVAEVLAGGGLDVLPYSAKVAIVVGALIGLLLPILEKFFPKHRNLIPSAMGLGLSWVMPFANALSFAIGSVIAWIWSKVHKSTADTYTIPIASGLIAGESLIKAFIAMAATIIGLLAT